MLLARYAGFAPVLMGSLWLAHHASVERGDRIASICVAAGLPLLAFARPETPLPTLILTAVLAWDTWTRSRRADAGLPVRLARLAGFGLVCALVLVALPGIVDFFARRLPANTLLGDDAMEGRGAVSLLLVLLKRGFVGVPLAFAGATLFSSGLLLLAAARVPAVVRRREGDALEWASLLWVASYLVLTSPHREGLGSLSGSNKYMLLVAVPIWYLANRYLVSAVSPRRRRVWAAVVAGLTAALLAFSLVFLSINRSRAVRQDAIRWHIAPAVARHVCVAPPASGEVCVLLGASSPFDSLPPTEYGPEVEGILSRAGCEIDDRLPTRDGDAGPSEQRLPPTLAFSWLCSRPAPPESDPSRPPPICAARHAFVILDDAPALTELRQFLASGDNCGWRLTQSWPEAALLTESPPSGR